NSPGKTAPSGIVQSGGITNSSQPSQELPSVVSASVSLDADASPVVVPPVLVDGAVVEPVSASEPPLVVEAVSVSAPRLSPALLSGSSAPEVSSEASTASVLSLCPGSWAGHPSDPDNPQTR